jgi:hypothetical protein
MEGDGDDAHSLDKCRMGVDVPPLPLQHLVTDFFKLDLKKLAANATKVSGKKRGHCVKRQSAKAAQGGDDKQHSLTKAQRQSMKRLGLSGAIEATTASTEEAATALKRMSHSKDTKMQEAMKEWDVWDVDFLGTKSSKEDFTKHRRVNKNTFYKYVKDDKAVRTII